METLTKIIGSSVIALATILALGFLLSWPVYMLWNGCLVDAVSGIKEVSWLQAWSINVLCGILFKTTVTKKD